VDGTLAVVLWRAIRDVLLWAQSPSESRAGIFPPLTAELTARHTAAVLEAPELVPALDVFMRLHREPEAIQESEVAGACQAVYRYADRHSLSVVAAHFAEAAAWADPSDAAYASDAGFACRITNVKDFPSRSAAWYQRAFILSIRARNEKAFISALTGYGALMKKLGNFAEARSAYLRAARRAVRTGRRRKAARAFHYLFALGAETDDFTAAVYFARKSLSLYPVHDSLLPYLGHDWAFLLLRRGVYGSALRVLRRVERMIARPLDLVLVLGTAARAAGGAGAWEDYQRAESAIQKLIPHYPDRAAGALIGLAEGARSLGLWQEAASYADDALRQARGEPDPELVKTALVLIDVIRRRVPPEKETAPDAETAALTRRLAARLRRWEPRSGGNLDAGT